MCGAIAFFMQRDKSKKRKVSMNKFIIYSIVVIIFLFAGIYFLSTNNKVEPISQNQSRYKIEITSKTDNIILLQPTKITYKIKDGKGEFLKKFEIAHEKIMHFIVVRHDLQDFQHLHPEFNQSTGEFSVEMIFPNDGPYRIFPDFTPGDDNSQKLAVTVFSDIKVGDQTRYKTQPVVADKEMKKTYSEYQVTFAVPKIKAKEEFTYSLLVEKNGQSVTDLEKYLGALGHSVIIKEGTLDFIHTHALEVNTVNQDHGQGHGSTQGPLNMGPQIDFSTTFPKPGIYKIFAQFQHQGKIITADYIIEVK